MSNDLVDVVVTLESSADADLDERDRLARQLRMGLRDLDLDVITDADRRAAPPGAKGADLAEWGVWLVAQRERRRAHLADLRRQGLARPARQGQSDNDHYRWGHDRTRRSVGRRSGGAAKSVRARRAA